jgi:predicted kinase
MSDSVVVLIIGVPGAGKSTLISRVASSSHWTVLDPDRFRQRLSPALRRLPGPYPLYVLAVVLAIARHSHVVVESRAANVWLRRLVARCARVRGRDAVLVLLDASSEEAMVGQIGRARRIEPAGAMRWHTSSWSRLLDTGRSGALAAQEGWSQVVVLDRAGASNVDDLDELISGRRYGTGRGSR